MKVETWRGRWYFVIRDSKGRIVTRRKYRGSGLIKKEAMQIYKQNKTLYKEKTRKKLEKVNEISHLLDSSIKSLESKKPIVEPDTKDGQYIVTGTYKNREIYARSQKKGSAFAKTNEQAKEEAWNSFLRQLSYIILNKSDEDEGIKLLSQVKNLKEGWVYYK